MPVFIDGTERVLAKGRRIPVPGPITLALGPAIERHPRFPKRVNAGFLQIVARAQVRLRVYERGAGETRSCGTGACAAVAVGRRRGLLDARVRVATRGGELQVDWQGPGENIWLTGLTEISFEGHVEV